MKNIRIIARLDIKGPNVVKGVQFECLRVMGKPGDLAQDYYEQGADELIYLDTVASLYQRDNLFNIVKQAVEKIFIPITAGGGVRTLEDIRSLLSVGADKVAINTAATLNPQIISEAARLFGSQCIVVSIEAKRREGDTWEAYTDNGRQHTGLDVVEWAREVERLGAGEILLTSVDNEGMKRGLDLELIRQVSGAVSIPVIASGGTGSIDDVVDCFKTTDADAVAAASIFHYKNCGIDEVKEKLINEGVMVRRLPSAKRVEINFNKNYDIHNYNKYTERHLDEIEKEKKEKININLKLENNNPDPICVIDYKLNNVNSVVKAFEKIGRTVRVIDTPEELNKARCLILPGVGAFEAGMNALKNLGLIEPLKKQVTSGVPLLGICLGMQMLFTESKEFGLHQGLDFISGQVVPFAKPQTGQSNYKLPHIGWNEIKPPSYRNQPDLWNGTLLKKIPISSSVYYVHSYFPLVLDQSQVLATTVYGGQEFCGVVKKGSIVGTQFHPERSGEVGLAILRAFCEENNF